jgi:hypothetical protein
MCITPVMAEKIDVQGGSIDVDVKDNTTNWNVTGNPVWNVPEFNVPQGNIYNIAGLNQGASLALLVNGGQASNIFGTMNLSNLDFILQNIAGINIGASAMINLNNASLIASTLPLNTSVTDFLARQYEFSGQGGFLTNDGKIVGNNADLVALVANAIENKGTIEVPMGTVALAAGDTVTVGISGDGLVSIGVDEATANKMGLSSQIKNSGTISADGGRVLLNAQAMDGLFEKAISLERNGSSVSAVTANNGTVEFQSMDDIYNDAVVQASGGTVSITSTQGSVTNAGTVEANQGKVALVAKRDIVNDAIMSALGGEIRITSTEGAITNRGTVKADNGVIELTAAQAVYNKKLLDAVNGKIDVESVKSDVVNEGTMTAEKGVVKVTSLEGKITNAGVMQANNGSLKLTAEQAAYNKMLMEAIYGKIEVTVQDDGGRMMDDGRQKANTSSDIRHPTSGNFVNEGTMDATGGKVELNAAGAVETSGVLKADEVTERGASFKMGGRIEVGTMDMDNLDNRADITAGAQLSGNFTDQDDISVLGSFSLIGDTTIQTDSDLTGDDGTLTWAAAYLLTGNGYDLTLKVSKNSTVGAISGVNLLTLDKNTGKTPTYTGSTSDDIDVNTIKTEYGTTFSKDVTVGSDHMIYSASDAPGGLQYMDQNLGYSYKLANNIDASETSSWNSGAGFDPVGNSSMEFSGSFNGNSHVIDGLYIYRNSSEGVGLLGYTNGATISDVGLTNEAITAFRRAGGLVGGTSNHTTISRVYTTGALTLSDCFGGGIVGTGSSAIISDSHSSINITSVFTGNNHYYGGIAGTLESDSEIRRSYATGAISGSVTADVGGLAGINSGGLITDSYATGDVIVTGGHFVGGLVGLLQADGFVQNSHATGNVSSTYDVGGLVGRNGSAYGPDDGYVTNSYATGNVSGNWNVGGLIGTNDSSDGATIAGSYATGNVSGSTNIGGLVGNNTASGVTGITSSYSHKIYNVLDLQLMQNDLDGNFTLMNNIDASDTVNWNSGAGFDPIGDAIYHDPTSGYTNAHPFTGDFDGAGHTITGLTINRPNEDFVGLFGLLSGLTVKNVGVVGVSISGGRAVGGLAGGDVASSISNSYSTGSVSGGVSPFGISDTGGLVGYYGGSATISNSYSAANVSATGNSVGGLVGMSWRPISNSYSTGSVSAIGRYHVGGLVGNLQVGAQVSNSYSTGSVNAGISGGGAGGLIGANYGTINNSYSTATVNANSSVGGLVGYNSSYSTISNSYSTGQVSASSLAGGLAGANDGNINNSYWDTQTTGQPHGSSNDYSFDSYGKTTAQMKQQATFSGWDFDADGVSAGHNGTWIMAGLPHLQNEWTTNITNAAQLQMMALDLDASYTLANDIDASETANWNAGLGFDPVGGSPSSSDPQPLSPYSGTFDGQGHTITGLTITRHTASAATTDLDSTWVGLFGAASGTVKNVGMLDVNIWGNLFVGGLVGELTPTGTVMNSYTTGSMRSTYDQVGGLVGQSHGTITNTYSTANIQGDYWWAGGLVGAGQDASVISNSYATGNVSVAGAGAGGLVGVPSGTISHSFATGTVSGGSAGGLVSGYGTVTIDHSYFTGGPDNGRGTYEAGGAAAFNSSSHPVYSGWDFTNGSGAWDAYNDAVPHLQWENYGIPLTFYSIAGLISGLGEGISVALSLNGAAPVTTTTTLGGAFNFSITGLSGGEYMLIYANDGSYQANLLGKVQSAGNISGLQLQDGRFAIGDADGVAGTSFTNADLSSAYYNNSNVHYSVSGSDVTFLNGIDLWIPANVTYTPGGNITTTGSWINQGVFNAGNFSVNLQGTGTHTILSNGSHFNDLTVQSGSYGLQDALHVDGDVTIVDGFTGGPAGYDFRKTITIDHTQVAGDLSDFPVLFSVVDPSLSGKVKSGSNYTLKFTNSSGTVLPYEVESYDDGTGALTVWVKLDSISSSADTSFHVYYGTDATAATDNPTAVWDANYMGVWHMNTSGSTLLDSKGTYNGSIVGTPDAATGAVGGALTFIGNQEYVAISNTVSTDGSYTIQCWVNLPGSPSWMMEPVRKGNYGSYQLNIQANGDVGTGYAGAGGTWHRADTTGGGYYEIGSWQQMMGVYDAAGQTIKMYLNGQLLVTSSATTNPQHWDDGQPMNIGSWYGTRVWTYEPFVGTIDEVRFSNTNRSDAWIATEFNNQSAPSAFLSIGNQTGGGAILDTNGFSVNVAGTLLNQGVLTATAADLSVAAKAIDSTGTISTTTSGDINIDSTAVSPGVFDLGAINSAGAINIGATNAPTAMILNNDITSQGNAAFNAPVVIGADVNIDTSAGNGNVTFGSSLNSDNAATPRNLALTTGTGDVTFQGAVGGGENLYQDAIGWWNFNDGTANDTAGGHNGTAYGDATATDNGKVGKGFIFDGDGDYIYCGNISELPGGNEARTMSLWLKMDTLTGTRTMAWGSNWDGNGHLSSILMQGDGTGGFGGHFVDLNATQPFTTGTWYHIAFTYDGTQGKLYVDGALNNQANFALNTTGKDFYISRIPPYSAEYTDGAIDEVGVWNRVLTDSEIANLYNGGQGLIPGAALGVLTINSAKDVTFASQVNAASVTQTAGTGTTTFNGAVDLSGTMNIANTATALNGDAAIGGDLNLSSGAFTQNADLNITGDFNQTGGTFTDANPTAHAFTVGNSFSIPMTDDSFMRYTGDGLSAGTAYKIYDVYGLQAMQQDLDAYYQLNNNITATGTSTWNADLGFAPIGSGFWWLGQSGQFTGKFDGQDHTISNLHINRPSTDAVGLFGVVHGGTIENVGLVDGSVTGGWGTGGLVGGMWFNGTVSNVYNTGSVTGGGCTGGLIGLTGYTGTISNSHTTGNVSGTSEVGGLVGNTDSTQVSDSYATGNVMSSGDKAGGLVGQNNNGSVILRSYATGDVSGADKVGGLVGRNSTDAGALSDIQDSYATGNVTGTSNVGGLVGFNTASGITGITSSYSHKVYNVLDLQLMQYDLDGSFTLMNDVDASATSGWNSGAGFDPIGDSSTRFSGIFEGNSKTITGLTINRPYESYVGLFGYSDTSSQISNLGLVGGSVSGDIYVGGLTGYNKGTLSHVYTTGNITGAGSGIDYGEAPTGGVVGRNDGTISYSYATGTVANNYGDNHGGFVGQNAGNITDSYATGNVTAGGANSTGGFVGANLVGGVISRSNATGNVTTGDYPTGGFAGRNDGTISLSYATGNVNSWVSGGFVGVNNSSGVITDSYSTGSAAGISGNNYYNYCAGGFVAANSGSISRSYSTGNASAGPDAGGFAAVNDATGSITDSFATGSGLSTYRNSGGFVANNAGTLTNNWWFNASNGVVGVGLGSSTGVTKAASAAALMSSGHAVYTGASPWDLSTTWKLYDGLANPLLKSFLTALTVTANAFSSKTYDGTTNVTGNGVTYSMTPSSELKGTVSFSTPSKNVGTQVVSIGGLYSTQQGYDITYVSGNLTITPKTLTVSATGTNKVYDGNTTGTVTLSDNRIAGDVLTDAYTTATFANKNAGIGKAVNVAGISISGVDAANYTLASTSAATTANITQRTLTVSGTGTNKVYDGTTTGTVTLSDNRVAGDVLTGAYTTAVFADKNVGVGKAVTISGISISGTDAANYSLASTSAATTANITAKAVTLSGITASNKVYDTTTAATVNTAGATFAGKVAGDTLTVASSTGVFNNKNVGTGKTITLTNTFGGADLANYTITDQGTTTANITAFGLTVTGVTVDSKVYDATTVANVNTGSAVLVGALGGDTVSLNAAGKSGVFANKNVGAGKSVTVSGLALSGADAANYTLSQPAGLTADITQASVTLSGITASDKVYDGVATATVNAAGATFVGKIAGDVLTVSSTGAFSDKNVASGKTVTLTNVLGGADLGNYTITDQGTTTANITAKAVTLSGITASNKVYDTTTAATVNTAGATFTGKVAGDVLTVSSTGTFADKNVAAGKTVVLTNTLGGADLANYTITDQGTTTANITAKALTISGVTASDKVYDATATAALDATAALLSGMIGGDAVSLNSGAASGVFANKNVGTGKTVTVSGFALNGADALNYSLSQPAGLTANITQAAVTLSGITASNKVYDSTVGVTVNTTGAAFAGKYAGDVLTVSSTGAFSDKNVAAGKTVTLSNTFGGADAGNYTIVDQGTTTADITKAAVTLSGITASNKVYDSTTAATVSGGTFSGKIGADDLTVSSTGTFADKNVATGKIVTLTNTLGGADLANYQITEQGTTTADITKASATLSGITASNKIYDSTVGATISTANAAFAGKYAGDELTVASTGVFADKNVGANKSVSLSNAVGGTDLGNYTITDQTSTIATITKAPVTLSGITAESKVYDGTAAAAVSTAGAAFSGKFAGDDLTVASTGAFNNKYVGANKTVNLSNTLGGADLGNYQITDQGTTVANITALVSGAISGIGAVPVALALNGVEVATTTADANGSFSFGGDLFVAAGDALLVYVNNGLNKANLVGTVSAPESITNLSLTNGQVSVGSASAVNLASSYTNSDFTRAKESLTNNIYYSVSNNALTVSGADLYIPANVTFTQSGNVAVTGNFTVASGATFRDTDPLAHSFTVSGNFSVPYSTTGAFKRYTGSGHENDPYMIRDIYDLQAMNSSLSSSFRLNNALDLSAAANWNDGEGFNPIGAEGNPFSGTLHGNGQVLKNLTMHRNGNYSGLFGNLSGNVDTLGLEDATVYGLNYTGALAGFSTGNLTNVYTTGSHTVSGVNFVGGLVGGNQGNIANAYSSARVTGTGEVGNVGGLVGENSGSGTINKTYAMGYVTGTSNTGGLVGANTSTAPSSVSNSFWDKKMTGQETSAGGTAGKAVLMVPDENKLPVEDPETIADTTSPDMMSSATYSGWDFANTWVMDEGGTYPHFQFRYPNGVRGVGGHVYLTNTVDDVTTTTPAGAGKTVSFYYSTTENGSEASLNYSVGTGASSRFYGVLDMNAVTSTDTVIGKNLGADQAVIGSSQMQAGAGSIYPLDVWAKFFNRAAERPVMPTLIVTPPPAEVISEEAVSRTLVDSVDVGPIMPVFSFERTIVPEIQIDQPVNTDQNFNNFSNLIGGVPVAPMTEPLVVVAPPTVMPPATETPSPAVEESADVAVEDTLDEIDVSFAEETSPGREPVPVASETEEASSKSADTASSKDDASAEAATSEGEGSVEKATTADESETTGEASEESDETAASKDDSQAANWRDVPIAGFDGDNDPKKFLTDVRVIEGAVYVIDGANVMNLLGMGDSMRIFYKRKKPSARHLKALAKKPTTETTPAAAPAVSSPAEQALDALLKKASAKTQPPVLEEPEATPAPEARVLKSAIPIVMGQTKSGDRYGTLKNPGKDVFVKNPGGEWKAAKDGMVILPGDEVKTAPQNSVNVLMDGGATGRIEIKEGSLFRIQKAVTDATTGDKSTILELAIGKILVKVESIKGNGKFEVRTPTALTGVRGTVFEVSVREKS